MADSSYIIHDTVSQQTRTINLIDNDDGTDSLSTSGGVGGIWGPEYNAIPPTPTETGTEPGTP